MIAAPIRVRCEAHAYKKRGYCNSCGICRCCPTDQSCETLDAHKVTRVRKEKEGANSSRIRPRSNIFFIVYFTFLHLLQNTNTWSFAIIFGVSSSSCLGELCIVH